MKLNCPMPGPAAPRRLPRRQPLARLALYALLALAVSAMPAAAHTETGPLGGFLSDFQHPIFGLDHLIAMFAVGLWGAQMGGRSMWTLPVVFPLIMAVGGILGVSDVPVPRVEIMIGLSVLGLGLAIAYAWKAPEALALFVVGIFAIFHGYAHGAELPATVDPVAYGVGFVTATGLIHVAGIAFGLLAGRLAEGWVARGAGAGIGVLGVYFLSGAIGL